MPTEGTAGISWEMTSSSWGVSVARCSAGTICLQTRVLPELVSLVPSWTYFGRTGADWKTH